VKADYKCVHESLTYPVERNNSLKRIAYFHIGHSSPYTIYQMYSQVNTASVVYWPEFFATDTEARVRLPALPEKKEEELLDRKVAAPV
jgi:hypothetical protein